MAIEADDPTRNPDGTIKPGVSLNPNGANGHMTGYQRHGRRVERYGQMPFDELEALINDKKTLSKYSSFERSAMTQAYRMGDPDHKLHISERELALDRVEGKVSQPHKHGGDPDNPTPISHDGTFTLNFGTDENDDRISRKVADKAKDADLAEA